MAYNPYLMAMVGPAVEEEAFGAGTLRSELRQTRSTGRLVKLGQRAALLKQRISAAKQAGRKTGVMERRLNSLMRRVKRIQHSRAGSSNAGESDYLYNQFIHTEDDAGMLPGYDPYAEGALGGIPDDDEDILGDLDPDLLDDIEDEVEGSMSLNPQWAQLMHEADYGPEGYSEVAMSYMSPVEQVDDLFSPYIIERSGIADFDADEVESMMGDEDLYGMDLDDDIDDEDLYGMDLDDDIDDDDFDDDELGGRGARRKRRSARKSARQEHRSARKSARKTHRSKRRALRNKNQNRGARKGGPGKDSTRPISVTSQQDDPIEKSSNATITTQAVPSKRAAGNNGMPGPPRRYYAAMKLYRAHPNPQRMDTLTRLWADPMWKKDTRRRRLPSPESVRLRVAARTSEEGSSNYGY